MNKVTLPQIEAFYWTATLGSVQKAADKLGLSQPALSLRIKDFEYGVGAIVFERANRKLKPNRFALEMLGRARKVLDAVDALSAAGDRRASGIVKVGFAEGFALACLPQIVERLHQSYPDIHAELTIATSSSMEPSLHDGKMDLAFLVEPREVEGFTYVYLGLQPTAWAASTQSDYPVPLHPNALARERIICNQPGTIGYRQVIRWFASEGIQPFHLDICSSVAIQAKLIQAGTGVGILPEKMIEQEIKAGRLKTLEAVPPVEPVAIFLVHRSDTLTPQARALIECVGETLRVTGYLT